MKIAGKKEKKHHPIHFCSCLRKTPSWFIQAAFLLNESESFLFHGYTIYNILSTNISWKMLSLFSFLFHQKETQICDFVEAKKRHNVNILSS